MTAAFVTVESETLTSSVTQEQFWKGVGVWIKCPHVENRRLCGVKTVLYGHVLEPESALEITDRLLKLSLKKKQYDITDSNFVNSFLESAGIKLENPGCKIPITGKPDEHTIILKIRQLIPKNKDKFQPCLEAIVLDGRSTQASFIHLGNTDDFLSPRTPYCCGLKPGGEGAVLEFGLWQENRGQVVEEGAEPWLRTKLFPRLVKWIVLEHNPSSALPEESLGLVDLSEYNEKYQQLKKKYGPHLVEIWPEQTDPLKFVYEDVAIASYLLCVWGQTKPSFVDLGCGNGLLVHILCSEGHAGLGLDVRSRKLWALFPPTTRLEVCSVVPSIDTTFPDFDWIIGNHSDELTPWIPVMAALSSPKTNFFVLPCCAHDFWGKYQRLNATDSQYTEYIKFVRTVGETCGFKVEIDKLRIPSTKRTCLIGRHRFKTIEKTVLWEYVTSRRKSGQDDFTPRPATERVRNCTKLASGVAESVVKLVSDKLLAKVGEAEGWGADCELPLSDAAALVPASLKAQMKSECGGLQTLLRNHHHVFLVQGGVVSFREPKPSVCTDPARWKNKPCWFFKNHPKGCPLQEDLCSFDHK